MKSLLFSGSDELPPGPKTETGGLFMGGGGWGMPQGDALDQGEPMGRRYA